MRRRKINMLLLDKFKKGPAGFPSLINYFGAVEDGIVLNSDGSLMRSMYYYCPDLDSAIDIQRHSLSVRINNIINRLGTGWMVNVDMIRVPVREYLLTEYYRNTTLRFFEGQRIERFIKTNQYFETVYALTLTFKPSIIQDSVFKALFIEGENTQGNRHHNMQDVLAEYK
ncbi:MAG: hypothetical protein KC733_09090, partial [Candidatus Omnitrophica bacterium]|nr:hypothetical protein [Candidatus Omnitrophota bacterium]